MEPNIIRPNFIAPPIKGREVLNFEKLQATDIEQSGIKYNWATKRLRNCSKFMLTTLLILNGLKKRIEGYKQVKMMKK
jgi:hypothetical protein